MIGRQPGRTGASGIHSPAPRPPQRTRAAAERAEISQSHCGRYRLKPVSHQSSGPRMLPPEYVKMGKRIKARGKNEQKRRAPGSGGTDPGGVSAASTAVFGCSGWCIGHEKPFACVCSVLACRVRNGGISDMPVIVAHTEKCVKACGKAEGLACLNLVLRSRMNHRALFPGRALEEGACFTAAMSSEVSVPRIVGLIPARLASTRLPDKPLVDIARLADAAACLGAGAAGARGMEEVAIATPDAGHCRGGASVSGRAS